MIFGHIQVSFPGFSVQIGDLVVSEVQVMIWGHLNNFLYHVVVFLLLQRPSTTEIMIGGQLPRDIRTPPQGSPRTQQPKHLHRPSETTVSTAYPQVIRLCRQRHARELLVHRPHHRLHNRAPHHKEQRQIQIPQATRASHPIGRVPYVAACARVVLRGNEP